MKNGLINLLKGLWIGGTMTVPGVSGGSMAMLLGVYDRLIFAVSSFRKAPKKNFLLLMEYLIGGVLGVVLFSKYILTPLIALYPLPTRYFFLGAVAGGAPMIFKTAGVKKLSVAAVGYPVIGIVLVLLIAQIPEGLFSPGAGFSLSGCLLQLLGGLIIAVGFVLPGISLSQMLLMLGLYEQLLAAVDTFNLLPFVPLGVGVAIGALGVAKGMEHAMTRYPEPTYLIIFGFLLGSLPQMFPGVPTGIQIPICLITAVCGFFAIFFMQRLGNKRSD